MPGTIYFGNQKFSNCTNIEEINLTGTGTIPNSGQYSPWYISRNKLLKITIENGISAIGSYTFYNLSDSTRIEIDNSENNIELGDNWSGSSNIVYLRD